MSQCEKEVHLAGYIILMAILSLSLPFRPVEFFFLYIYFFLLNPKMEDTESGFWGSGVLLMTVV